MLGSLDGGQLDEWLDEVSRPGRREIQEIQEIHWESL